MINLNKRRIDFGKGDVGIGAIGNTTDSAQLAFYNQSARPIHILKNPDQNPGFESMEFEEEPFIMSFSKKALMQLFQFYNVPNILISLLKVNSKKQNR